MGRMARKGNAASATVRRLASAKRNEDLLPVIEDLRAAGAVTPQQIADGLNERGITATQGNVPHVFHTFQTDGFSLRLPGPYGKDLVRFAQTG
jgi:hypothetical protein